MPEPIVREPLCRVRDCPRDNDPDFHKCLICDTPKNLHHHHVEKRSLAPGRVHDKTNIICLCAKHHDDVTTGGYKDEIKDGFYVVRNRKDQVIVKRPMRASPLQEESDGALLTQEAEDRVLPEVRPAVGHSSSVAKSAQGIRADGDRGAIPPLTADWSAYTDEQLVAIFQAELVSGQQSFLKMCKAVWQIHENHKLQWGASWTESAYKLFENTDLHPNRTDLESYLGVWRMYENSAASLQEHAGLIAGSHSLVRYIGRTNLAESQRRMEAAVDYQAQYGQIPSVAALAQKVGVESGERHEMVWVCADCGSKNVQRREK